MGTQAVLWYTFVHIFPPEWLDKWIVVASVNANGTIDFANVTNITPKATSKRMLNFSANEGVVILVAALCLAVYLCDKGHLLNPPTPTYLQEKPKFLSYKNKIQTVKKEIKNPLSSK